MAMLNLKVFISLEGNIRLEGWFIVQYNNMSWTKSHPLRNKR